MQDDDGPAAVRARLALANASRSIGDEPFLTSQLVRIAAVERPAPPLLACLLRGEPADADLLGLQQILVQEEQFPRLLVALRGEARASTNCWARWRMVRSGCRRWPQRGRRRCWSGWAEVRPAAIFARSMGRFSQR